MSFHNETIKQLKYNMIITYILDGFCFYIQVFKWKANKQEACRPDSSAIYN